jgi:hypothetical protein
MAPGSTGIQASPPLPSPIFATASASTASQADVVQISTTAFVKQLESKGITIAEISLTTGLDEATVKFLLD